MVVLVGCGPAVATDGDSSSTGDVDTGTSGPGTTATTTSATSSTTTPGTSTTSTSTTTSTTTSVDTSTNDDGVTFILNPDATHCFTHCSQCDVWAQDCADGEKCAPWANDGGDQWNATICLPIDPSPGQPGDPCTIDGNPASGHDDCDLSNLCWDVDADTGVGHCVPFCGNSEADPQCAEGTECFIANEGVLILCLPTCDPLAPACGDGLGCVSNYDEFFCVPAERVVETYAEPCDPYLGCGDGLECVGPAGAPPACEDTCCTTLCDLEAPTCPDAAAGQVCVPYFERGMAPAGRETLGVCLVE